MPRKRQSDQGPKVPSKRAEAFNAWREARGLSTAQVARDTGVSQTTLASFVQGDTQQMLGGREERIAQHYGVSAEEIFGGKSQAARPDAGKPPAAIPLPPLHKPSRPLPNDERLRPVVIPVISATAAGRLADPDTQIPPGDYPTIEIGGLPPGDYFATRVDGTSMDRISPHGSLIVVNRAEREPLRGRRYIFGRRGKTTYKRWEPDPMRLVPESTDPSHEPIFPRSDDEWIVIGRVRLTLLDDL